MVGTQEMSRNQSDELRQALSGGSGSSLSRRRRVSNRLATVMVVLAFFVAAVPLAVMGGDVLAKGAAPVMHLSWWTDPIPETGRSDLAANDTMTDLGFGTAPTAADEQPTLGMAPAIVGTVLTVLGASLLAIPIGILGAVYLHEYGKHNRLARVIRFMSDVMSGVPSVIMGVFIYTVWVLPRGVDGRSAWAAALALACLMLPIVVRSTEEMLRLVPNSLREGSAALGTRTWRTTVTVVLPAAMAGIVSGCLLAVARAAGETAPVVFVIGFVHATNWSMAGANTTLSAQIYSQQQNGGDLSTQLAWGAAVTLVGMVLVLNLIARSIVRRYSMK